MSLEQLHQAHKLAADIEKTAAELDLCRELAMRWPARWHVVSLG